MISQRHDRTPFDSFQQHTAVSDTAGVGHLESDPVMSEHPPFGILMALGNFGQDCIR